MRLQIGMFYVSRLNIYAWAGAFDQADQMLQCLRCALAALDGGKGGGAIVEPDAASPRFRVDLSRQEFLGYAGTINHMIKSLDLAFYSANFLAFSYPFSIHFMASAIVVSFESISIHPIFAP